MATPGLALAASVAACEAIDACLETEAPDVPSINIYEVLVDSTRIVVTRPAGTEQIESRATLDDVRHNLSLWRRMDLANWNNVAEPLRDAGIGQHGRAPTRTRSVTVGSCTTLFDRMARWLGTAR